MIRKYFGQELWIAGENYGKVLKNFAQFLESWKLLKGLFFKIKKNLVTPNVIKINSKACRVWKIRGEKVVNMNLLKFFDLKKYALSEIGNESRN